MSDETETRRNAASSATALPAATGPHQRRVLRRATLAAPGPKWLPRPPGPVIEYAMPVPKQPFKVPANLGCLVKMMFGLVMLILMGYCALVALNPKARQWATKGARDGSGGPTPFNALNQILAIPAQAVGKTKDVVAASDARVGVLDNVIAEEDAKAKGKGGGSGGAPVDPYAAANALLGGSTAPAPGMSAARTAAAAAEGKSDGPQSVSAAAVLAMNEKMPAGSGTAGEPLPPLEPLPKPKEIAPPTQVKLGGGIVITSTSPEGAPVASQPFLFWVVNLNISGVFQAIRRARPDEQPRLVYEGQEVSAPLGITFDHLEPAKKLIVFRDKSGAIVTRQLLTQGHRTCLAIANGELVRARYVKSGAIVTRSY